MEWGDCETYETKTQKHQTSKETSEYKELKVRTPFLQRMKTKTIKKRAVQVEINEEVYIKVRHLLDENDHTWHDLFNLACEDYIAEVTNARKTNSKSR